MSSPKVLSVAVPCPGRLLVLVPEPARRRRALSPPNGLASIRVKMMSRPPTKMPIRHPLPSVSGSMILLPVSLYVIARKRARLARQMPPMSRRSDRDRSDWRTSPRKLRNRTTSRPDPSPASLTPLPLLLLHVRLSWTTALSSRPPPNQRDSSSTPPATDRPITSSALMGQLSRPLARPSRPTVRNAHHSTRRHRLMSQPSPLLPALGLVQLAGVPLRLAFASGTVSRTSGAHRSPRAVRQSRAPMATDVTEALAGHLVPPRSLRMTRKPHLVLPGRRSR